jgi:hypothetical protein
MCAWVTKVSAAMVEVEVTGDNGQHEVSSVMAEVEVSCEVVWMAAVGKVPWRCRRRRRAWAGGVDGEGRGVGSDGGGVRGVAKVREVSTVRAEVSCAHGSQRCRR